MKSCHASGFYGDKIYQTNASQTIGITSIHGKWSIHCENACVTIRLRTISEIVILKCTCHTNYSSHVTLKLDEFFLTIYSTLLPGPFYPRPFY